jgi:AraC family transcriptional regulator
MDARSPLVEQEYAVASAQLKIHRFDWRAPIDDVMVGRDSCYFDMCLTPRPPGACGSYLGHFAASHYEPLGRLMFVPAGLPLAVRAHASARRQWALQCWFDADAFEDLTSGWNDERLRESLHLACPSLLGASTRVVREMTEPGFASDVVIEAMCATIMVDLVRHFSRSPQPEATPRGGLPGWRMRRIEERVREGGAPPSLDELAVLCAMSPRHLTRAFRQETGASIGAFIQGRRIERAKSLLAADDLSLKEVAEALGFTQASAFSTAFRRAVGERPSGYRARVRAGDGEAIASA